MSMDDTGTVPEPPEITNQGTTEAGPNPDYKGPPLKRWNRVEIAAVAGTEFGIVKDTDVLLLTMRREGEEWPHGMEPIFGENTIRDTARFYAVVNDDCGYGVETWQQFAAYCRSCALSGESNPQTFEEFIAYQRGIAVTPK